MSQFAMPMTEEVEQVVTKGIFDGMDRLLRFEGRASAAWLVQVVTESCSNDLEMEVAPGYVVGLVWELIDKDVLRISIRGDLIYGPAAH